jgi:APA family basic amino acid/polyamine antiporter
MTADMDVTPPERGHCVGNPLFRTKSIERILADSDAPEHRLKRSLTAWDLTGLGIGAIIGTGIFVLIGTAIVGDAHRPGAGPGVCRHDSGGR